MTATAKETTRLENSSETLTVYWEDDPGRSRIVTRGCKVCRANPNQAMIVSPSGVAHHSEGYGVTVCGKDATGPDWWWKL